MPREGGRPEESSLIAIDVVAGVTRITRDQSLTYRADIQIEARASAAGREKRLQIAVDVFPVVPGRRVKPEEHCLSHLCNPRDCRNRRGVCGSALAAANAAGTILRIAIGSCKPKLKGEGPKGPFPVTFPPTRLYDGFPRDPPVAQGPDHPQLPISPQFMHFRQPSILCISCAPQVGHFLPTPTP